MDPGLRFVYLQTFAMLMGLLVLAAIGAASLPNFLVVSFVSLLVVAEYTAPIALRPRWRRRLRWVLVGGAVIFAYVSAQYLMSARFRLGILSELFG
jgi:hypothetical protein